MIQYWPNLQPGTNWIQLTNCYPANSTNRTTYVVSCCQLAAYASTNSLVTLAGGSGGGGGGSPPSLSMASGISGDSVNLADIWVTSASGSGEPVPLLLYPPGYDLENLAACDPPSWAKSAQSDSAAGATLVGAVADGPDSGSGPLGLTSGGCDCPEMGFFRVWHIPDWDFDITSYIYDGPTFLSVDFKDYRERVDNIEVLLNGPANS